MHKYTIFPGKNESQELAANLLAMLQSICMSVSEQIIWLFVLPIPISCVAWTVTHEEVFKEVHEYCVKRSKQGKTIWERKFFYLFTCEYCFSHYVTIFFLLLTGYKLIVDNWSGYLISFFAVVWIANIYMSLFAFLRQAIKKEKTEIEVLEQDAKSDIKIIQPPTK
jgi:hypothetical protein